MLSRLLFALAALLALSTNAVAQEEGGAGGVTMKLMNNANETVATCMSKDDGSWSFSVPKPGEYTIVVDQEEFENARRAINTKGSGTTLRTASATGEELAPKTISFSWSMKDDATITCYTSPRDHASGLPTGKRQHAPVQFIKEMEKTAPTVSCTKACTISGNLSYTAKQGKTGKAR
jgi:hypothetical protein